MKRTLAIILSALMALTALVVVPVGAHYVGDWEYDIVNDEVVITNYKGHDKYVTVYSKIDGMDVVGIADYAFYGNAYIEELKIYEPMQWIGEHAFEGCAALRRVEIKDNCAFTIGECAFYQCEELTTVILGNGVQTIEDYAFDYCDKLENVTLGDRVAYIGDYAFAESKAMQSFSFPDSVKHLGEGVLSWCTDLMYVEIGSGITSFPKYLFEYTALKYITIPDRVTYIGSCVFQGCDLLESITIPDTVTHLGSAVFAGCCKLTEAVIGKGVKTLEYNLFIGCDSLYEVTIPYSVGMICEDAFKGCDALSYVYYGGYEEDWDNVTIVSTGNSTLDTVTLVTYSPEVVTNTFGDWEYYLHPNGTAVVCGYLGSKATETIPFQFDGHYVVEIAPGAFYYNDVIEFIAIPNNVKKIGYEAFCGCSNLKTVQLTDGLRYIGESAFYECKKLKSVRIPNSVEIIENYAFDYCDKLETVDLGKGVWYIGDWAFAVSYALRSVVIPDSLTAVGVGVFSDCYALEKVTLGKGMAEITDCMFDNSSLKSIDIPENIKRIGYDAFYNTKLEDVVIPSNVKEIGDSAFARCDALRRFVIPEGFKTIPYGMCHTCISLKEVTIPLSVREIGFSAFSDCDALETVYYAGNAADFAMIDIDDYNEPLKSATIKYANADGDGHIYGDWMVIFHSDGASCTIHSYRGAPVTDLVIPGEINGYKVVGFWNRAFASTTSLKRVTIPSTVKKIGYGAFAGCTSLTDVSIPDSVTEIGTSAFEWCSSLKSIDIPSSVDTIGNWAFAFTGFETFTVPASVKHIGADAFSCCEHLREVTIPEGITEIADGMFGFDPVLETVNIPKSVTKIGEAVFGTIDPELFPGKIDVINFAGSEARWNKIDIHENNEALRAAKINFAVLSDGDFEYKVNFNDTATVTGYLGDAEKIVIPEKLGGKTVTCIGESAFENSDLHSVTLPKSLEYLYKYAFASCDNLASITIPEGVTALDQYVFKNCAYLETVIWPVSLDFVTNGAFSGCSSLATVYYAGSEDQWNAFPKGIGNSALTDANIVFNYVAVKSGDANGDGKINSRDVIITMKAVIALTAGAPAPDGFVFDAADMVKDGKINSRDVIAIMKAVIAASAS